MAYDDASSSPKSRMWLHSTTTHYLNVLGLTKYCKLLYVCRYINKFSSLIPGRVTIGSDPTCDIYVVGTGVSSVHCRVENSHGVVTLYPLSGSTLLDGLPVDKPTRLSQGVYATLF